LVTDLEPFVPDLDVNFSEREANPQPAESLPTTFVVPITKLAMESDRESAANTSRGGFPNRSPGSMHSLCCDLTHVFMTVTWPETEKLPAARYESLIRATAHPMQQGAAVAIVLAPQCTSFSRT
jgi:hypothetical protein